MAGPNGMSVGGPPNFDGLGIFYIFFAALWTVIVFAGLVWLHSLRFSIAVRIRNFWLIASAVVMLGLYEIAVLIRYPMNGVFKCGAEFWIMSAVLPFSIALFQGGFAAGACSISLAFGVWVSVFANEMCFQLQTFSFCRTMKSNSTSLACHSESEEGYRSYSLDVDYNCTGRN